MRVLIVSKPVAPPYNDGTRCLVRDLSSHLKSARPTVLTTSDAPPPGPGVEVERIYPGPGAFAPPLADNARVLRRLLLGSRHDLWHFVFAPNPASSSAMRVAATARRMPVVHTVPSAPRSFEQARWLLFGKRVVCVSRSTRNRLVSAGVRPDLLEVIPPPLVLPSSIGEGARREATRELGLPDDHGPLLLYPGDLEVSSGAQAVANAAAALLKAAPGAHVVLACRAKTPHARDIEARLRRELAPLGKGVIFAGQVLSLPALMAACRLVLFPVDDLYGKVDLPLSLLEAQALGVPVVALQQGPLRELEGAVPLHHTGQLADVCAELLRDERAWEQARDQGQKAVREKHDPDTIAEAYEEVYRKACA